MKSGKGNSYPRRIDRKSSPKIAWRRSTALLSAAISAVGQSGSVVQIGAVGAAAVLTSAHFANAQTYTWTGGTVSAAWSTPTSNWSGGIVPAQGGGSAVSVIFNQPTNLTPVILNTTLDDPTVNSSGIFQLNNLTFKGVAPAVATNQVTVAIIDPTTGNSTNTGGNTLQFVNNGGTGPTLTLSGVNNAFSNGNVDGVNYVISTPISLSNTLTINGTSDASLELPATNITGSGGITINLTGTASPGIGGTGGQVLFGTNNTNTTTVNLGFTGNLTLQAGTLDFGGYRGSPINGTATLTLGTGSFIWEGGTLTAANQTITNSYQLGSNSGSSILLPIISGNTDTLIFSGSGTIVGNITLGGGESNTGRGIKFSSAVSSPAGSSTNTLSTSIYAFETSGNAAGQTGQPLGANPANTAVDTYTFSGSSANTFAQTVQVGVMTAIVFNKSAGIAAMGGSSLVIGTGNSQILYYGTGAFGVPGNTTANYANFGAVIPGIVQTQQNYQWGNTSGGSNSAFTGTGVTLNGASGTNLNGALLDLDGTTQMISSLSGTGYAFVGNSNTSTNVATLVINTSSSNAAATFAGGINNYAVDQSAYDNLHFTTTAENYTSGHGKLAIVVEGNGTQIFSGSNSFTGGVTVSGSGAILQVQSANALGFGGLTQATTAANSQGIGNTTVSNGGSLDLHSQTLTEPIVLNGGTLTNSGVGIAGITSGIKGVSYTGSTGTNFAATSSFTITDTGGGTGAVVLPVLSFQTGSVTLNETTTNANAQSIAFLGGNLFASGPGDKILGLTIGATTSGANFNVKFTAGDFTPLYLGGTSGIGTITPVMMLGTAPQTIESNATVVFNASNMAFAGLAMNTAGSGYYSTSTISVTFNNPVTGGTSTLSGLTPVLSGVSMGSNGGSVGGNNGDIALAGLISGTSASGSLTKIGSDNLFLSAPNTWAGGANISAGAIVTQNINGLGKGAVTNSASLVGSFSGNVTNAVNLTGGTLAATGANGFTGYSGAIAVGSGGGTLLVNDPYATANAESFTVSGPVSGSNSLSVSNSGTGGGGVATLSNSNSGFSGAITVNAGATLYSSNVAHTGNTLGSGQLNLAGGTLAIYDDNAVNYGNNVNVTANSTLSVNPATTGSNNNIGVGNVALGGNTLTVNATGGYGLQINGTLHNGGTLAGNGPITVTGTVAPGDPAILNASNLAFTSAGTYVANIDGPGWQSSATTNAGINYDQIEMGSNSLGINGATLNLVTTAGPGNGGLSQPNEYFIVDEGAGPTGTFGQVDLNGVPMLANGNQYTDAADNPNLFVDVSYNGNIVTGDTTSGEDVVLTVTSVPEPSALALLGLGATALLARRRRRKSSRGS